MNISLVPFSEEHCQMVYSWRNSEKVRAASFDNNIIPYDVHKKWFNEQITGQGRLNYIFIFDEVPCGVVYFDLKLSKGEKSAYWGFYKDPSNNLNFLGLLMEKTSIEYAFESLGVARIYCDVLAENKRVLKLHEMFGFEIIGLQKTSTPCKSFVSLQLKKESWNKEVGFLMESGL